MQLLSRTRSPKTTAKPVQNNLYCFFIIIFRLAIPAFFKLTDVTVTDVTFVNHSRFGVTPSKVHLIPASNLKYVSMVSVNSLDIAKTM